MSPKNTGRGTRHAAATAHQFRQAKSAGGSFVGVTRPGRRVMGRFLDWLLGPKCPECGQRVAPVDAINHPKDCSA